MSGVNEIANSVHNKSAVPSELYGGGIAKRRTVERRSRMGREAIENVGSKYCTGSCTSDATNGLDCIAHKAEDMWAPEHGSRRICDGSGRSQISRHGFQAGQQCHGQHFRQAFCESHKICRIEEHGGKSATITPLMPMLASGIPLVKTAPSAHSDKEMRDDAVQTTSLSAEGNRFEPLVEFEPARRRNSHAPVANTFPDPGNNYDELVAEPDNIVSASRCGIRSDSLPEPVDGANTKPLKPSLARVCRNDDAGVGRVELTAAIYVDAGSQNALRSTAVPVHQIEQTVSQAQLQDRSTSDLSTRGGNDSDVNNIKKCLPETTQLRPPEVRPNHAVGGTGHVLGKKTAMSQGVMIRAKGEVIGCSDREGGRDTPPKDQSSGDNISSVDWVSNPFFVAAVRSSVDGVSALPTPTGNQQHLEGKPRYHERSYTSQGSEHRRLFSMFSNVLPRYGVEVARLNRVHRKQKMDQRRLAKGRVSAKFARKAVAVVTKRALRRLTAAPLEATSLPECRARLNRFKRIQTIAAKQKVLNQDPRCNPTTRSLHQPNWPALIREQRQKCKEIEARLSGNRQHGYMVKAQNSAIRDHRDQCPAQNPAICALASHGLTSSVEEQPLLMRLKQPQPSRMETRYTKNQAHSVLEGSRTLAGQLAAHVHASEHTDHEQGAPVMRRSEDIATTPPESPHESISCSAPGNSREVRTSQRRSASVKYGGRKPARDGDDFGPARREAQPQVSSVLCANNTEADDGRESGVAEPATERKPNSTEMPTVDGQRSGEVATPNKGTGAEGESGAGELAVEGSPNNTGMLTIDEQRSEEVNNPNTGTDVEGESDAGEPTVEGNPNSTGMPTVNEQRSEEVATPSRGTDAKAESGAGEPAVEGNSNNTRISTVDEHRSEKVAPPNTRTDDGGESGADKSTVEGHPYSTGMSNVDDQWNGKVAPPTASKERSTAPQPGPVDVVDMATELSNCHDERMVATTLGPQPCRDELPSVLINRESRHPVSRVRRDGGSSGEQIERDDSMSIGCTVENDMFEDSISTDYTRAIGKKRVLHERPTAANADGMVTKARGTSASDGSDAGNLAYSLNLVGNAAEYPFEKIRVPLYPPGTQALRRTSTILPSPDQPQQLRVLIPRIRERPTQPARTESLPSLFHRPGSAVCMEAEGWEIDRPITSRLSDCWGVGPCGPAAIGNTSAVAGLQRRIPGVRYTGSGARLEGFWGTGSSGTVQDLNSSRLLPSQGCVRGTTSAVDRSISVCHWCEML